MEVSRVRADEWEALRDLRLRALADAPDAFRATIAEARERPEEWWREWARDSAESDERAMFVARLDGRPVGLAGVYHDEGVWNIVAMWVAPEARLAGAGRALLDATVAFARENGGEVIELDVTDGNAAARRLYESCGFVETGRSDPLRMGSPLVVRALRLERS